MDDLVRSKRALVNKRTLLHVFPSFAVGGQQTRFATIANRLGCTVRHRLISLDRSDQATALLNTELDFAILQGPPPKLNFLQRLHAITSICRAANTDVLITYNWGAIEFALANRLFLHRPNIHFEDGFGPDEAEQQKARRILLRRLVLQRSELVVPSRNLEKIARNIWHLPPHHVTYIPNGIDPERFNSMSTSGSPFFVRQKDDCIIGSFSPLRPEKNLSRLLTTFARMPSSLARLVICGEGPDRAMLMERAEHLGVADRVTFTGHVQQPALVMGAFDIFVMTSDTEQMPYAVIEAMASRLPVVATKVGDIPVMVSDQNQPFIVPLADDEGLFNALVRLSSNEQLRRTIGNANRTKVQQQFSIELMVDAFQCVLDRILR